MIVSPHVRVEYFALSFSALKACHRRDCDWYSAWKNTIFISKDVAEEDFTNSLEMSRGIQPSSLAHYSKSQIFVQKFNFYKTFSRVFHPKIFLTIFLVKSKLSTAKKSKTAAFFTSFHPKQFDKVEFLDKKWRFRPVW